MVALPVLMTLKHAAPTKLQPAAQMANLGPTELGQFSSAGFAWFVNFQPVSHPMTEAELVV